MHPLYELDEKMIEAKKERFVTVAYSTNSLQKPKFFNNADYYFTKGQEKDAKV